MRQKAAQSAHHLLLLFIIINNYLREGCGAKRVCLFVLQEVEDAGQIRPEGKNQPVQNKQCMSRN